MIKDNDNYNVATNWHISKTSLLKSKSRSVSQTYAARTKNSVEIARSKEITNKNVEDEALITAAPVCMCENNVLREILKQVLQ